MDPRTSEGSRADNLSIGLLFVLDAHTSQREVCKFELPFETSGKSTVTAISPLLACLMAGATGLEYKQAVFDKEILKKLSETNGRGVPIYQIHRDARWFSEPNRFNPYRWKDGVRRPKFSYFPFGGGPRNCFAQHFAMAELVLELAAMLSQFRFRLVPGANLEMDAWLPLRPRTECRCWFRPAKAGAAYGFAVNWN